VFYQLPASIPRTVRFNAEFEKLRPAGPLRKIALGKIERPVAAAPEDVDFEQAASWRIRIPENVDLTVDPILRVHYAGDVARVTLDGKLITDDFYNGNVLEIGLRRHAPAILKGDLRVTILPLDEHAPIYLPTSVRSAIEGTTHIVDVTKVEIVPRYHVSVEAPAIQAPASDKGSIPKQASK
jgi:hypothetical protein